MEKKAAKKKAKKKVVKKKDLYQHKGSDIPGHGSTFRRFFPNL